MAKKIITCKAAPELELQFDGGVSILLRFDVNCLVNIQELGDGMKEFLSKNFAEMAAAIIYAAGKDLNPELDEDKAREIVSNMSVENITEIVDMFQSSIGGAKGNDEIAKKLMAQFLASKK